MVDQSNTTPTPAIDAVLADLRALLESRTAGDALHSSPLPWRATGVAGDDPIVDRDEAGVIDEDYELAVAAVNALPALRGEIERLRAELALARGYEQEAVAHLRAVCEPNGQHVTAVMRARAWLVGDHDA